MLISVNAFNQIKDNENEMSLSYSPIIKFNLADDSIIRLDAIGDTKTKNSATTWGFGLITGNSNDIDFVLFHIPSNDSERLKQGISKVSINTIPYI